MIVVTAGETSGLVSFLKMPTEAPLAPCPRDDYFPEAGAVHSTDPRRPSGGVRPICSAAGAGLT